MLVQKELEEKLKQSFKNVLNLNELDEKNEATRKNVLNIFKEKLQKYIILDDGLKMVIDDINVYTERTFLRPSGYEDHVSITTDFSLYNDLGSSCIAIHLTLGYYDDDINILLENYLSTLEETINNKHKQLSFEDYTIYPNF